jgi:hypothetical protein
MTLIAIVELGARFFFCVCYIVKLKIVKQRVLQSRERSKKSSKGNKSWLIRTIVHS